MVEITSQPKILVNFYLELLKEYSESTVVSRNKRQKKSVLKAFLEVYENNVVQNNIFLENFLENYIQYYKIVHTIESLKINLTEKSCSNLVEIMHKVIPQLQASSNHLKLLSLLG